MSRQKVRVVEAELDLEPRTATEQRQVKKVLIGKKSLTDYELVGVKVCMFRLTLNGQIGPAGLLREESAPCPC